METANGKYKSCFIVSGNSVMVKATTLKSTEEVKEFMAELNGAGNTMEDIRELEKKLHDKKTRYASE